MTTLCAFARDIPSFGCGSAALGRAAVGGREQKDLISILEERIVRLGPKRVRPSFLAEFSRFENSRNVEMRTIELVAGKMFYYVLRDW